MPNKQPTKKMSRKAGRNKDKCAFYRLHRSVRNKLRKLKNHLDLHPADFCAITAIEKAKVQF